MIDLEAIRARVDSCRAFLKANPILASGYMLALGRDMGAEFSAIFADADALLAEVERLRAENDRFRNRCQKCGYEFETAARFNAHPCVATSSDHTGPALAAKIRAFNSSGEK